MRTVFLGSYGHGNLGDELCLMEALDAFPSSEAHVLSSDPARTLAAIRPRQVTSVFSRSAMIAGIAPERIVLGGGGVGVLPMFATFLGAMAAHGRGAELHIHNIGVANITDLGWVTPPIRDVLARLASFSVRDTVSQEIVRRWKIGLDPRLTRYPERLAIAGAPWPGALPPSRRLGLSVTGQGAMRNAVAQNRALLQGLFAAFPDHAIVPVISTLHATAAAEDDARGFRDTVEALGIGDRVAMAELLDPAVWARQMTVTTLNALIGSLDVLVSQRKHNCVHAFGRGVPAIGIHPASDDSLPRLFNTVFGGIL